MFDNGIQADGSYSSAHELALSRATSALAARASGNIVCRAWSDYPVRAPLAEITDPQTMADFTIENVPADQSLIPFMVTPGFTDIVAIARIASTERVDFQVRMVVREFTGDSMDPEYSSPSAPTILREPLSWGSWRQGASTGLNFWCGTFELRITPSDLPASRRCLVGFQASAAPPAVSTLSTGGTVSVFLESVVIVDSVAVAE